MNMSSHRALAARVRCGGGAKGMRSVAARPYDLSQSFGAFLNSKRLEIVIPH